MAGIIAKVTQYTYPHTDSSESSSTQIARFVIGASILSAFAITLFQKLTASNTYESFHQKLESAWSRLNPLLGRMNLSLAERANFNKEYQEICEGLTKNAFVQQRGAIASLEKSLRIFENKIILMSKQKQNW